MFTHIWVPQRRIPADAFCLSAYRPTFPLRERPPIGSEDGFFLQHRQPWLANQSCADARRVRYEEGSVAEAPNFGGRGLPTSFFVHPNDALLSAAILAPV
jgi:hypothetical protein